MPSEYETLPIMKPWRALPIHECHEPLCPLPPERFAFFDPPPYLAAGAPYNGASPWQLREGVLKALLKAQGELEALHPGWKIKIYDAFRPNAVQAYMVELEFKKQAKVQGLDPIRDREALAPSVWRLWSVPSENPATPPIHSTGAALDCTLQDETGADLFMGSPIDENSDRSNPLFYEKATDAEGGLAHKNRLFLFDLMKAQGFRCHPREWWHFSIGDQLWAWLAHQETGKQESVRYGRAE